MKQLAILPDFQEDVTRQDHERRLVLLPEWSIELKDANYSIEDRKRLAPYFQGMPTFTEKLTYRKPRQ